MKASGLPLLVRGNDGRILFDYPVPVLAARAASASSALPAVLAVESRLTG